MARRVICLALGAALFSAVAFIDPATPSSPPRQITDTNAAPWRQTIAATVPVASADSLPETTHQPASDVVAMDYPFDAGVLEQLQARGEVAPPHPGGGLLRLTLRQVDHRHGTRVFRVMSDDLPGVITQRGARLMGTIATRRGTYSLTADPHGSWLIDQRQLDLRMTPNQQDYRHAPSKAPAA